MTSKFSTFICQNCGSETSQYFGRCTNCNEWNTIIEEHKSSRAKAKNVNKSKKSKNFEGLTQNGFYLPSFNNPLLKKNSTKIDSNNINFVITDFSNEIIVSFSGSVPNLFKEEKGVVAEGYLRDKNFFIANKILAKHDENYMPPEVKEALEGK